MNIVWKTFSPKIVREITVQKSWLVEEYDDNIEIVRTGEDKYHAVLEPDGRTFSILRESSREQILENMNILVPKLKPFLQVDVAYLNKSMLDNICSCIWENPTWSLAHVAVKCNFEEAFTVSEIVNCMDSRDGSDGQTPLHLAVKEKSLSMVRTLLDHGASVYVPDENGDTVLHSAVEIFKDEGDRELLAVLSNALEEYEMMKDVTQAFTPLIMALKTKKFDAARILVENDLLLEVPDEIGYPIHHALKQDNYLLTAKILAKNRGHGFIRCKSKDATPLHWARSPEMIKMIFNFDYELNVRSKTGHTAVHVMVQKRRIGCLVELLAAGADPEIHDNDGNHPLHTAATLNDVDAIRALIVFNADVNAKNLAGLIPRHLAAMHEAKGSEALQALHLVGSKRCEVQTLSCNQGCLPRGMYDGDEMVYPHDPMEEAGTVYKESMDNIVENLLKKCREYYKNGCDDAERYERVLCLDGGGSRGSVQIQLLAAIERACDKKIIDCFDWIAGTSAGAINTGILSTGVCITEMRRIFFGTTGELFEGTKPYSGEKIERLLKQVFGEKKLMDIERPKIMITSALCNRRPPALHLFRNYPPPATSSARIAAYDGSYDHSPVPTDEEYLWSAVRSSTAAPTFFPPKDLFMDGGLISNNPTTDALTEISEYKAEKRLQGEPVRKIGLVVSLGTGNGPIPSMKDIHVYIPQSVTDIFSVGSSLKAAAHLGEIMLSLTTDARFRPVDRARSWCRDIEAAYFRLSPNLSLLTDIDETDTSVLLRLLWETQVYVHNNRDKIEQIGELLSVM